MSSGERLIGTAKGKQSDTEALCQTPRRSQLMWGMPFFFAPLCRWLLALQEAVKNKGCIVSLHTSFSAGLVYYGNAVHAVHMQCEVLDVTLVTLCCPFSTTFTHFPSPILNSPHYGDPKKARVVYPY